MLWTHEEASTSSAPKKRKQRICPSISDTVIGNVQSAHTHVLGSLYTARVVIA